MTSNRLHLAILLTAYSIQAAELQPFEAVEPHMGTMFLVKLYAATEADAQKAFRAAFERVAKLDEIFSDYKADTELSRLTVTGVGHPVPVSKDLFRVLSAAQAIAAETDGAFDVTLGPLTHLWRLARKTGQVPTEAAVRTALMKCGYRKLHLVTSTQSVVIDEPGMQLDAGGIAKGYAADEALASISASGISQALVAASGDLAFSDSPPGKTGWSVGIDSMDNAGAPFTKIVQLKNSAVSTSGDSQQHLDSGGLRYSHILDSRTGMGLTSGLTVTVVARHGIEADALTKVVSVWGREKGLAFIEHLPGTAAFVVDRTSGKFFEQGF